MSKIAICNYSIGDNYKKCTYLSRLNKIKYCKKYNYDFIEDETIHDNTRHITWSKINLILKYISKYDYIVWIDSDILIMNNNITIESFINKYVEDIIIGSCWKMINTGFIIVKNTDFSKQFLKDVYHNIYDIHGDIEGRYEYDEQGSIINLFDKNHLECQTKIKVTEPLELNSYESSYLPGHYVIHFTFCNQDILKKQILKYYPDKIIESDVDFEERIGWVFNKKLTISDIIKDLENESSSIQFITISHLTNIINQNNHHFNEICNIVQKSNEKLDNNCFYIDNTFDRTEDLNKQINLFSLAQLEKIEHIIEIGFNAGHSTLIFLLANPKAIIYCFDLCDHSYKKECFNYLSLHFPNRLFLFEGISYFTIPSFIETNNIKCDLIHIDGSYDCIDSNFDFFNTLPLTKYKTILIVNTKNPYLFEGYVNDKYIYQIPNNNNDNHLLAFYMKYI